jgi:DNA polymerase III sliding clamp (beta) subunit (PCNA family)
MRSIGEMARNSGLTVSALRFYDGAGVLSPAWVDPQTGYRRYSPDQVDDARLVARLRRVGMPLAEIRLVLEHRSHPVLARQLLDAHLRRLEDGLADARRELSFVRALLDHEENPMIPTATATRLTVAGTELAAALDAVSFAVSDDSTLPALGGVLFEVRETTLWLVATDRYRLAVATAAAQDLVGPEASVIVPAPLVDQIRALLSPEGAATLTIEGDRISAQAGGRQATGQRLDHDFPDYRRLLRDGGAHRVTVEVAALRDAVTSGATRSMIREHDGAQYDVTVLTVDSDGALVVGTDHCAEGLRVGVNREFLLQALAATARDQLVLELDGPITPLAIRVPDREHPFSLLMPTRLS